VSIQNIPRQLDESDSFALALHLTATSSVKGVPLFRVEPSGLLYYLDATPIELLLFVCPSKWTGSVEIAVEASESSFIVWEPDTSGKDPEAIRLQVLAAGDLLYDSDGALLNRGDVCNAPTALRGIDVTIVIEMTEGAAKIVSAQLAFCGQDTMPSHPSLRLSDARRVHIHWEGAEYRLSW
jgi:hypothetical protein